MKKTKSALVSVIVMLLLLMTACGKEANNEAQNAGGKEGETKEITTIRIGHTTVPSMLAVAKEQGFLDEEFNKDGISIQYDKFLSGPPLVEAFAGERLDFGQVGDQPAIQARANNINIKAVGVYSSGEKTIGLVIPEGSNVTNIKELKGKKIGVTAGSVGHRFLNEYLKQNGMSSKDIQQVNLQPPDIKTSLEQKNIDAAAVYEPWISTIELEGLATQIVDGTDIINNYSLYVVSESFAKNHPDLVERLLKVLDKAEKWSRENPEEAIENISKFYGTDTKILEGTVERTNYDIRLTEEAIDSIQKTSDALRESKVIRRDVDVNNLVDTSFLKNLNIQ